MTAPEPLMVTLEELAVQHGVLVWKDPTSEAWVAGRIYLISPHDPARYHQGWEPLGIGATWPEAASRALGRKVVAHDGAAELRAALAEMSDLVYTIRSAEEELENAPLLRDAGASTAHMQETIENAWERLCELAALHDDTSALIASEEQP